jgi:molecular chaperone GrpE
MAEEEVTPEEVSPAADEVAEEALPEEQEVSSGSRDRDSSAGSSSVEQERDQYRELAQRVQADFENYKKRVVRQEQDRIARAEENLVIKLLPVLDTIDLALAHDPNGSLEQVRVGLLEVLEKEGLERVADLEAAFDPTVHEAVAHEPGDGEQRVSDVMRAGYRWNGRVVRPAMVKVTGS